MKEDDVILKDKLIVSSFISNLFYSIAYPTIHFVLIKDVGEKYVALNSIVICLGGMLFPVLWNKRSDKLYKVYGYLLTTEGILYTLIGFLIVIGAIVPKMYYILDTLLFAIISKNVICGNNKLLAFRYKDNREEYDNNYNIVANASSLIGFTLNILLSLDTNVAFILLTIGIIFDNIFYYQVYKESYTYCTK